MTAFGLAIHNTREGFSISGTHKALRNGWPAFVRRLPARYPRVEIAATFRGLVAKDGMLSGPVRSTALVAVRFTPEGALRERPEL